MSDSVGTSYSSHLGRAQGVLSGAAECPFLKGGSSYIPTPTKSKTAQANNVPIVSVIRDAMKRVGKMA